MNSHEENTEKEEDQADRDTPIRKIDQNLENGIVVNPDQTTDVIERSEKNNIENQDEIHLATPIQGINSHENRKSETDTEDEEIQLIEKTQEINLKEKVIDSDEQGNTKSSTVTFDADFHHRDISQVSNKSPMEQDADKWGCEEQKEERGKMDLVIQKGEINLDIIDTLNVDIGINADIDSQVITPGQRNATDEEKKTPENTDNPKGEKRLASSEDEISDSFCGFVGSSNFKEDVKNTEDAETKSKEKLGTLLIY